MPDARLATSKPPVLAAALAFVAGYIDAATFVGAGGVFSAHVTGNFVTVAADMARHAEGDKWLKLATFPIFIFAIAVATEIHKRSRSPAATARLLLAVNCVLFGLAVALGWMPRADEPEAARRATVAVLVTAMGFQNAIHHLCPAVGPMTTVMTGNVTQWFVEVLLPATARDAAKHRILGSVIVAFAAGCAAGALGVTHLGFVTLLAPLFVTVVARSSIGEGPHPSPR